MKITIDLKYFVIAIISLVLAYLTLTYEIDKYIEFAGELNAMFFFICTSTMGLMALWGSFVKLSK